MTTTKNNAFDKAQLFAYIDSHSQEYIDRLAEAVAIPSISSDLATHLPDIQKMMEWTQSHITRLHGKSTLQPNPASTEDRPLPPILLADFQANDHPGKKKTICVYGHLDVQPAAKEDGWDTDPFTLVQKDGKLYGRGSTDDKGPALGWLWTIEAYQALGVDLPVNVKLIYEGMEVSLLLLAGVFVCLCMISYVIILCMNTSLCRIHRALYGTWVWYHTQLTVLVHY